MQQEKSRSAAATAALAEHRSVTDRLGPEIDAERVARGEADRRAREGMDRLDSLRADLGVFRHACF